MVSVIIPVYNVETYLKECLDSILAQSYQDFEVVIIDDGSTDSSGEICDAYARGDSRIHVYHMENHGLSAARNAGVERAKGEYISFVDSDDYLPEDALEYLMNMIREHDADLATGNYTRLFEDGSMRENRLRDPIVGVEVYTGDDKMDNFIRLPKHGTSAWGRVIARELLQDIRFPEGKIFEDVFVAYQLVHAAKRIALSAKPVYVYRKRKGSIMQAEYDNNGFALIEGRLAEANFVKAHYPQLTHHTHVRLFESVLRLVVGSARGTIDNPEYNRQLQSLARKYLRNYLKCRARRRKKLLAILMFIHIDLARWFVRMYKILPNE